MGAAAFSAMFSTCITVMDGYAKPGPGVGRCHPNRPQSHAASPRLVLVALGGLLVVSAFRGQLKTLVDLATTLSFLVAPVIAFWNLRLVTQDVFRPKPSRPRPPAWAWRGLLFLTAFSTVYVWVLFSA